MLPRNHPDRIDVAFDDRRLVNNAGLILPATLALRLGLPELVDRRLDLGHQAEPTRAIPLNWLTGAWTWAMHQAEPTRAIRS